MKTVFFLTALLLTFFSSCKQCMYCEYVDDTGSIYDQQDFCSKSKQEVEEFKINYEKTYRFMGHNRCYEK